MKKILVLILTFWSFSTQSFSSYKDTLNRRTNPVLEIRYLNQSLTADILKKANPTSDEVMLFHISLSDSMKDSTLRGIGKTHITFIVNGTQPINKITYKDGTVLLTVHWPRDFPLVKGSKILFRINYRYQTPSSEMQSGELEKEILF